MLDALNIVRDCYWAMPSGNRYVRDEAGNLSSDTHGLYTSLNADTSQCITASDSGNFIYHGRLDSTNIDVDHIRLNLRANCTPAGSAVLYVNDMEMGSIALSTGDNTYSEYLTLDEYQKERVQQGRILSNYDHFAINLGSINALSPGSMPTPWIWLDAGSGVYEHGGTYSNRVGSGDITAAGTHAASWRSRGTNTNALYVNIYGKEYKPVWHNSVINGQPGIRWWGEPSGSCWLENFNPYRTDHESDGDGTIVVVCLPMSLTNESLIYAEDDFSGGISVTYNQSGFGQAPSAYDPSNDTNRIKYWQNPTKTSSVNTYWSSDKIPSGIPICYAQPMTRYAMDDWTVASGDTTQSTQSLRYGATDKPWFGDVNAANRAIIGAHKYGNALHYSHQEFDGFICEIMLYEHKLDFTEWDAVSRYIRDKYGIGIQYVEPEMRLIDASIAYSGESNWDNHQTGLPNVNTGTYVPTRIKNEIGTKWSGTVDDIDDGLASDGTYITSDYNEGYSVQWIDGTAMPSGYLSLGFGGIASGVDPITTVTRARMTLRMALPPSGDGDNVYDSFEINGYNHRYKNQDNIEDPDLSYIVSSRRPLNRQYGYFMYGAGSKVEAPDFTNYVLDLNFLDPSRPSGEYKSTRHANVDMLANMDFHVVGLPSGTQLSGAQLQVDYINDDNLSLYTQGNKSITRCELNSETDAGTLKAYAGGNGGWHHQGWRLYGPTVIEETVFDNFYTFSEVGGTRTYPETTKTYYYADDKNNSAYADFLRYPPTSVGDSISAELKYPQKREYYRNPVTNWDLTPYYESTPRATPRPSYYRHMVYHGDVMSYVDITPSGGNNTALDEADLCQIYFDDRVGLGENFTLYFSVYRHNNMQSYGRLFHRGLLVNDGVSNYEILGDIEPNLVRFNIKGADGTDNSVQVDINSSTEEPVLIWLSCGYEVNDGGAVQVDTTTMKLSVHQDTANYFATDWAHAETTFSGRRKQFSANLVRTAIGTLEQITAQEQLSRRLYMHRLSPVEFGYANEYIDLDYTTGSSVTTQQLYEVSEDKDKRFLSTRVSNSNYLHTNPSGVRWVVPPGSSVAQWTTNYNIFESWSSSDIHSVYNPVSTAGTNNIVHPSAIYVELDVAHATDHPSGVDIFVDVGFDSGTSDNWKVGHIEFKNIPSGGHTWTAYAPIEYRGQVNKHINMDEEPIIWTDLENINVGITTKYHGQDADYNGSVEIRNMKVYFDAFCVAGTGIDDLDLYTAGTAATDTGQLDLYTIGHYTTPSVQGDGALDLYIYGIPYTAAPSSVPLFIEGDPVQRYNTEPHNFPLFIEGLDPPEASGDQNLYIWGTTNPAIRDNTTLYMYCNIDPAWRLPLFIDAGTGSTNTSINLFLGNYPAQSNNELPLYTKGPDGSNDSMSLFIITPSGTDGAFVDRGNMNLYIDRASEAHAARMQLFLGNSKTLGTLNTFIEGAITAPSSIPLYVHGSGGPVTHNINLFTHGF